MRYSTFHFHEVQLKLFNSLLEKGFGRIEVQSSLKVLYVLRFLLTVVVFVTIMLGYLDVEPAFAEKLNVRENTVNVVGNTKTKQDPITLACAPPSFDYPKAILFQHGNLGGQPLRLSCRSTSETYKFANLSNLCMTYYAPGICGETWNDNVSSIKVESGCLIGWEHSNYEGGSIKLGAGIHGQVWNDALSSVAWFNRSCNSIAFDGDSEVIYYDGDEKVDNINNNDIFIFKK